MSLSSSSTFAVKEEPIEYEDNQEEPEVKESYDEMMLRLNETIAYQEQFIANTPPSQQKWIKAQIVKKEHELAARNPWLRRKEARVATKFKKMQIGVRNAAIEESHGEVEMRVNPGREAKKKLSAGVYKDGNDDDDVTFLGVFQGDDGAGPSSKRKSAKNNGKAGKSNGKQYH